MFWLLVWCFASTMEQQQHQPWQQPKEQGTEAGEQPRWLARGKSEKGGRARKKSVVSDTIAVPPLFYKQQRIDLLIRGQQQTIHPHPNFSATIHSPYQWMTLRWVQLLQLNHNTQCTICTRQVQMNGGQTKASSRHSCPHPLTAQWCTQWQVGKKSSCLCARDN